MFVSIRHFIVESFGKYFPSMITGFAFYIALCAHFVALSEAQPQMAVDSGPLGSTSMALNALTDDEIRSAVAMQLRRELRDIPKAVVSVRKFGAIGDGITDDSDAIERATTNVPNGEILVFPPGIYRQERSIDVTSSDVILWGYGAKLHGSNPDEYAVTLDGDRSSILGFQLTAVQNERKSEPRQFRIVLHGEENQVVANLIDGGAAGGIRAAGARHFRIDSNTVSNTLADGIHVTYGSQSGIVAHNTVRATGDDLIAVVGYRGDQHYSSDILITDNDVSGNPWGRGISVLGGQNITISGNMIRNVVAAAGIYIARESSWNTFGTFNVIARQNIIEHIQTQGEVLGGRRRTRHGAIQIYADNRGDPALTVQRVLIQQNIIRDALTDGVRIIGGACHIQINDNQFDMIGGDPIRAIIRACAPQRVSCKRNTLHGKLVSSPECSAFDSDISGASIVDR
jgi:parallel beta-helix repeat protein